MITTFHSIVMMREQYRDVDEFECMWKIWKSRSYSEDEIVKLYQRIENDMCYRFLKLGLWEGIEDWRKLVINECELMWLVHGYSTEWNDCIWWYCSFKLELAWLERQCGCGWWFSVRCYWWCIGCVTNRERKRFVYSIHSWFPFFCSLLIQWVLVVMSTDIAVYLRPANQTIVSGSTSFTAQSEAALSLPEGVWVAGVLVIIALILLAVFLISKEKKVRGHGVPSVCVE